MHDHKFDFSQPEIPCGECHLPDEVDESARPPHEFNIEPVSIPVNLTMEEACLRCHVEKGMKWIREQIPALKFQL